MKINPIAPLSFRDRFWTARVEFGNSVRKMLKSPPSSIEGIVTADLERAPANEVNIVRQLVSSYIAAKDHQETLVGPYAPGAEWKLILEKEWSGFRSAIESGDTEYQASFLRNFFRNEGLTGFWGGDQMFADFAAGRGQWRQQARADLMERQIAAWRELFPHTSIAELDAPLIGNPWGYAVDGSLLYEPVCEYHYQADYFARILATLERPNIVEIGGGFGGLAYHLLKRIPQACYIGFDLPEVTLLQSYYLSCAFPDAKLLIYYAGMQAIELEGYDIAILPNFMLPKLPEGIADLVINVRSFAEMPAETIAEYTQQVDRFGRLFFFHENIYKQRGGTLHGIPSSDWPEMKSFVQLASSESRWPRYAGSSDYPCRENLLIHRSILT